MGAEGRKGKKQQARADREALADLSRKNAGGGIESTKGQLRTAAKGAAIVLAVLWLIAVAFATGLHTAIPFYIASALTLAAAVVVVLILRNLKKSEALSALLSGQGEMSEQARTAELAKLDAGVDKGDAGAILARAQLLMQESPREALTTLEKVNLEKTPRLVGAQVRAMRTMVHLNLAEIKAARELADAIDLSKAPDPKSRANLAAVVAESWARSGNPIEAIELLEKYNPDEKEFEDVRMQLLRARVFAYAHRQDVNRMRRSLKALTAISPQLLGMFVGQKRIHPLLEKEARRALEKSGYMPRPKVQMARR